MNKNRVRDAIACAVEKGPNDSCATLGKDRV
jgi:hypothetical protein